MKTGLTKEREGTLANVVTAITGKEPKPPTRVKMILGTSVEQKIWPSKSFNSCVTKVGKMCDGAQGVIEEPKC